MCLYFVCFLCCNLMFSSSPVLDDVISAQLSDAIRRLIGNKGAGSPPAIFRSRYVLTTMDSVTQHIMEYHNTGSWPNERRIIMVGIMAADSHFYASQGVFEHVFCLVGEVPGAKVVEFRRNIRKTVNRSSGFDLLLQRLFGVRLLLSDSFWVRSLASRSPGSMSFAFSSFAFLSSVMSLRLSTVLKTWYRLYFGSCYCQNPMQSNNGCAACTQAMRNWLMLGPRYANC